MMEKNLQDEIRILHDEVKKRVIMMLKGQSCASDLFDEYGRERLHKKGTDPDARKSSQEMPYETMVRLKIATDDTRLEDDLRDLEERTERQVEVIQNLFEEKKEKIRRGDELPPGVIKLVEGLRRDEAQAVGRRQDGRPPRQQGRHRAHPPRGGHAVSAGRHAGGDRAEPARRSVAYERRPDSRDAPRLGRACARPLLRDAGVRRRDRERDQELAGSRRPAEGRQDEALRRHDRRQRSSRT